MSGGVPELTPRELAERLGLGLAVTLLDVREDNGREFCKIVGPTCGDLHIPVSQVAASLNLIRDAGSPLVVYCHHGVRSRMVADWLAAQGLTGVLNLRGGIEAWSLEVDPGVQRY